MSTFALLLIVLGVIVFGVAIKQHQTDKNQGDKTGVIGIVLFSVGLGIASW